MAEEFYNAGQALFQKGLYTEALIELKRAEDAFRTWESGGHPFTDHLPNGISGFANTLALSGRCYQSLGDHKTALTYYETSLINAKFEKKKVFRTFMRSIADSLIVCYEEIQKDAGRQDPKKLLDHEPEIDITFRFPFSLPPEVIPFARVYELSPIRYPSLRDYYQRAKQKDAEIRRRSKTADESSMKRISIYVWSILGAIWVLYGIIVFEALVRN